MNSYSCGGKKSNNAPQYKKKSHPFYYSLCPLPNSDSCLLCMTVPVKGKLVCL